MVELLLFALAQPSEPRDEFRVVIEKVPDGMPDPDKPDRGTDHAGTR